MGAQVDGVGRARQRRVRDQRRLDLALLPLVCPGVLLEDEVGDDETQHGVAEELERLVGRVRTTAVLVGPRPMRQRLLEQRAVAESVADLPLQRREVVAQRHHAGAGGRRCVVAQQHAPRLRGLVVGHAHAQLAEERDGHREHAAQGRPLDARLEALGLEQAGHERGLRLGRGRADHNASRHAGVSPSAGPRGAAPFPTLSTIIVMSSCCSAPSANSRTLSKISSQRASGSRSACSSTQRHSRSSP